MGTKTGGLVLFAAMSVLLHGAAVWLLLPHGGGRDGMETPPLIEIELVEQAALQQGAEANPAQPPPAPEAPEPPPPQPLGELPPMPPPPPPRVQEAPPGPAAPSTVNLGNAGQDQDPLSVSGPNVVPPRAEASIRNKPPAYPPEAARRGAQGTVGLLVHVTETGVPGWVEIRVSSGDAALDRAAQEAVSLWRFQPARRGGVPVPFDYPQNIQFTIGGR